MRNQAQGDRRWYNPERDAVWAFPRVISQSLRAFYENEPPKSQEEMSATFAALGRLCTDCRDGTISKDELLARLRALDPAILQAVAKAFFFAYFAEFHGWCLDIAPKDPKEDVPLDLSELEQTLELFARASRKE
jgi:hypothetical protein